MTFDIHRSAFPIDPLNKEGYWGAATSTLDWCEENYVVSSYIAEFWNTISNVNYMLLAILGIWSCYKINAEKRDFVSILGLFIVGLGSTMFHGTLLYQYQLSDELPMIYVASCLLYNALNVFPDSPFTTSSAVVLVIANIAVTVVYQLTMIPVFFQVAFGVVAVSIIVLGLTRFTQLKRKHKFNSGAVGFLVFTSIFAFGSGFLVWNIENATCDSLRSWRHNISAPFGWVSQLHAWWHILTGIGAYGGLIVSQYMRQIALGRTDVELRYFLIYPYLRHIPK